jgi:hypothetical protein
MMTSTYTIMPDYGGGYAWVKDSSDTTTWLGGNCADTFGGLHDSWHGDHAISEDLALAFAHWQLRFERTNPADKAITPEGGWDDFHRVGEALAVRLQAELADLALVRYVRPSEDPSAERPWRRVQP